MTRPQNAADPDRVIAAARGWLGTPYHDREVVGDEPFPIPPYSRDWGETGCREVLAEGARRMMIEQPVADAGPGTLILFRMRPGAIAKHVGIITTPDRFIHAYERLGVIEEPLTSAWRRRVAFAFLFPSI